MEQERLEEKQKELTDKKALSTDSPRQQEESDSAAVYDLDSREQELLKKASELEEKEKVFQRQQLETETMKALIQVGLSDEFISFVIRDDMEQTLKAIQIFKKAFDEAVQRQVELRLRGSTPLTGTGCSHNFVTADMRSLVRDALD